jgi:hypothetical protein
VTEGEELRFGWVNPTGNTSQAEPYGVRIDPVTGLFAETENHFSKLTPFKKIGEGWTPISSAGDVDSALTYIEEQDMYSEAEKQALVDSLHEGTELKEFIRCSRCHSKNGLMNFTELGFEPARINQLQKMEIGGMLTNYDTFYFPEIFKEKFK